ncbi:type II toxin-antitoxin system HicB family antitoxin [Thermoanaerobacterium sp. DL9XJH110]|uniref:type II toxin-antitoxin system HicB family antitoxin n=1 Tax=Thermoanaerobacterium sp. DL9XJH110 TaxID=3386643 RepID=UPI003BB7E005
MNEEKKYGLKISLLSEEDGGGYFIEVPDLPGCMTDGDTLEEAIQNAKQAIDSWIEAAKAEGKPIPEPSYYKDEDEYSGKLTIRIPKRLHKELAEIAQEEGISLNQLILYALSKEAGRKEVSASSEFTLDKSDNLIFTHIQHYVWSMDKKKNLLFEPQFNPARW